MRRCGMWCLLFVKNKLTVGEITALQQVLDIWSFCAVQDLNLTGHLADVYVIDMSCNEPIEQLFYSAKYEYICIYCAAPQPATDTQFYPQCAGCRSRDRIPRASSCRSYLCMFNIDLPLNANSYMRVKNIIITYCRSEGTVDDYEYPISPCSSAFKSWEDLKLNCELEWPKVRASFSGGRGGIRPPLAQSRPP